MRCRRSYFKYKDNVITVPHKVWYHSGGTLMKWFDENMPEYNYTLKFRNDENGKLIPFNPVKFVFDKPDAIMLFKLLGFDRWRNPYA